jgi:hypothetical protein
MPSLSGNLTANLPVAAPDEVFESLLETADVRLQRIVSAGQVTPVGEWLVQNWDEWVVLLMGGATLWIEGEPAPRALLEPVTASLTDLQYGTTSVISQSSPTSAARLNRTSPLIETAILTCWRVTMGLILNSVQVSQRLDWQALPTVASGRPAPALMIRLLLHPPSALGMAS